jgi:hypothetical protein
MSTVTEIKQAVRKLPARKKLALVRWLRTQVDDRLSDEADDGSRCGGGAGVGQAGSSLWQTQRRGEVWQVDFGLAAKVRPALVLGCDIADEDRVLVTVVYHTTALRGSRYEVPMRVPGFGRRRLRRTKPLYDSSREADPATGGIGASPTEGGRGASQALARADLKHSSISTFTQATIPDQWVGCGSPPSEPPAIGPWRCSSYGFPPADDVGRRIVGG